MKNIKRLERVKIDPSEDNNFNGIITEQVDVEIYNDYVSMKNEADITTKISRNELLFLLKELNKKRTF